MDATAMAITSTSGGWQRPGLQNPPWYAGLNLVGQMTGSIEGAPAFLVAFVMSVVVHGATYASMARTRPAPISPMVPRLVRGIDVEVTDAFPQLATNRKGAPRESSPASSAGGDPSRGPAARVRLAKSVAFPLSSWK